MLNEECKQWRRDHPFGFYAKPQRNAQGVLDIAKFRQTLSLGKALRFGVETFALLDI
jgi:hypothetical protein